MNQHEIWLKTFIDNDEIEVSVDICAGIDHCGIDGDDDFYGLSVATGLTEKETYLIAATRLRELADHAEKLADSL